MIHNSQIKNRFIVLIPPCIPPDRDPAALDAFHLAVANIDRQHILWLEIDRRGAHQGNAEVNRPHLIAFVNGGTGLEGPVW